MKIGFANIYSYRPHVEHLYYLSRLAESAGNKSYYFTCDSSVGDCYPRFLKKSSRLNECTKCIAGGVRSYPVRMVTSIRGGHGSLNDVELDQLALSSSCTLHRTESDREHGEPSVTATRQRLYAPIEAAYSSAMRWIESNRLEAVVCFNGRMDLTRAVTYACEQAGIPYVTHERTWFGDGLHLIPNANCLSLAALGKMTATFKDQPLSQKQAAIAAKFAAQRFLGRNALEWRLYNQNPEPAPWPLTARGKRVLVLPSSKNEYAGHEEWRSGWIDNTNALDDFFGAFGIGREQVVVRCHPNWAENIGKIKGERSLHLYRSWCQRRGIHCISSEEKASTYDLIQQADMIVVNGGSSAVEAGVCGKQVIVLGPAEYAHAGFARAFMDEEDMHRDAALDDLDPDDVIRRTLRYIYVRSHRFAQFVDYVRAIETTRYAYFEGADPARLLSIFKTGTIMPDDGEISSDTRSEETVLELLKQKQWGALASYQAPQRELRPLILSRRVGLRWIDSARNLRPRGDRS